MKLTLAEWIIRLTKGYKKATGKEPDGLAKLKIKMEAGQKVKDQEKVIDITSKIKDEWWKARPTKEGGITTVHHLRDPLKKYRDRIKPGSLLEDQAKTDPYAAKTHIVWSDFTDARIESISKNNKKINYKKMEDILETKLKGNETWDDLMTIRDRKFPIPEPEDMASGGIARVGYAAGKIVKGGAWVIKNLKKSRKEVIEGTGRFKNLNSMQQDLLKKELSALIKQLEQGGAIPDEMLQTMRQDKRFKDIVKTPSTDPELRELEEVLLRGQTSDDYLEALDKSIMETMDLTKADLENMSSTVLDDLRRNADPIGMHKHFDEITPGRGVGDFPDDPSKHEDILPDLEQFDVTGKTKHASGGIAGPLHLYDGGRARFKKGGKFNPGRRKFLKTAGFGLGALSMLPFVGKFFKPAAKVVGKFKGTPNLVVDITKTPNMPDWYIPLIKKVLNKGDDVTDTAATAERQRVHRDILPDGDEVIVTQNIDNQTIGVHVVNPKDGYRSASGAGEQPYQIQYSKGKVIEEGKYKGQKEPDKLEVDEPYVAHRGPDDSEIEFDIMDYNPKAEVHDTSVLESYATGKKVKSRGTGEVTDPYEGYSPDLKDPDIEYAKGGLAYMLGE